jgi:DNA-binding response OmpR family regulator
MRLLVVEDEKRIADFIARGLESAGYAVDLAGDGNSALHLVQQTDYDLIILDLMLPDMDGLKVLERIRNRKSSSPVMILSARSGVDDRVNGLELGADDYLTKPFNPPEVVARVKAILRRSSGAIKPSAIVQVRGLRLDLGRHTATIDERPLDLTPTEFDVLRVMMQNPDRAFTRGELIEKAVGYGYEGLERTVDSHIKNLRKKIEIDPAKPEYLETVFGVGYRLRE